ncbi:autotransporter outer membrane beta-barrel domain-containing protein [Agrobacterium sp. NPDC090273]|uniref:autotransporter family protein n=1 Tax=Agrobacterium sp. NPDC090273 TaxID=3363919 RepID=UPI00383A3A52
MNDVTVEPRASKEARALARDAIRSSKNIRFLSGVSLAVLALGCSMRPSLAASFTASNEAELSQAITDAAASGDASSTITLTGSFAVTGALPAVNSTITVNTGTFTLTLPATASFDVAAGSTLTFSGQLYTGTTVLTKNGDGTLSISGTTLGVNRIALNSGQTVINGGSTVTFGSSSGGALRQLDIASVAGSEASLTISGTGTNVTATGTDGTILATGGGTSTFTVEAGATYTTAGSIASHNTGSLGTSIINVVGGGSQISAGNAFTSFNGTTYVNVLEGGVIDVANGTTLGALGNNVYAGANIVAVVSGEGSRWSTGTAFALQKGSLSILDGGLVTATTMSIATATGATVPNASVLVSGEGSELQANAISVGTFGTGALTIANDGTVIVNGGASALVVGGADADSNASLNIGGVAGQAAEAAGTLVASAVTLAASAEINFNHTETGYVFDTPINGSGAINQYAGRTVFNAAQTGFSGIASIYGGVLEVNATLGGVVDVISGTLAGTGTVGNTTNQAGGTIAPGSNGIGTLTIGGDYTGNGGTLAIESVLGDDSSATDGLVVTGNTSGSTNVAVTNLNGDGALTIDGIRIVDVAGTSAGLFSLLGDYTYEGEEAVVGGAYAYRLYQGADGDWYLRSVLDASVSATDPLYQPGVALYEAYPQMLQMLNELDTLQQRVGNRYWQTDLEPVATSGLDGVWFRTKGMHGSIDPKSSSSGATYDYDLWKAEGGIDGALYDNEKGRLIGGLTAHLGTITGDINSIYGNGEVDTTGYGIGGTLTWYGNDGFYADAVSQATWYDTILKSDLVNGALKNGSNGFGYALSLEGGRRFTYGSWVITPQAQLVYSSVDFSTFNDRFGARVSLKDGDSLIGRLGVAVDRDETWQDKNGETVRGRIYGVANLYNEFLNGTAIDVSGVGFDSSSERLWAGVTLGGSMTWKQDRFSIYGELTAKSALKDFTDSYALSGTAGFRVKW